MVLTSYGQLNSFGAKRLPPQKDLIIKSWVRFSGMAKFFFEKNHLPGMKFGVLICTEYLVYDMAPVLQNGWITIDTIRKHHNLNPDRPGNFSELSRNEHG